MSAVAVKLGSASEPDYVSADITAKRDGALKNQALQDKLDVGDGMYFLRSAFMVRIKDAVTYLGFATIRNLVLSGEIFSQ